MASDSFSQDRIADRLEITHRLYQFMRGVDRRDYDLAKATYHPDAIDRHGDYSGSADGFFEWLRQRHVNLAFSHHQIGNIYIEFAGPDDAFCECYQLTWQSVVPESDPTLAKDERTGVGEPYEMLAAGRYVDHFKRKNGEWRVQERSAIPGAIMRTSVGQKINFGPQFSGGTRDVNDPSYLLRKKLGLS